MKKITFGACKSLIAITASLLLSFTPISGSAFAEDQPMIMHQITGQKGGITSLTFNTQGNRILSGSKDGTIRAWDAISGSHVRLFGKKNRGYSVAKFSPQDNFIVLKGNKNQINIVDVNNGRTTRSLRGAIGVINDLSISKNGQYVAAGGEESVVMIWRVSDNMPLHSIEGHEAPISAVEFSPDGEYLATVGLDGAVKIWEVATGYLAFSYRNDKPINDVAFEPSGVRIALASDDIKVIEMKTGQVLQTLKDHKAPVLTCAYSPNGKYLATGSMDKSCKVWSTATGRVLNTLVHQDAAIAEVTFSPDGYTLAAGGERVLPIAGKPKGNENAIVLWNVSSLYPDRRISLYVEREIYHWQKKGEFEKAADYQARLDKIDLEAGRLFTKAFRKYADDIREGTQISTYDPENEQFEVILPAIGKFIVNVPIEKAKMFKERFPEMVYRNFVVEPTIEVPAKSSWDLKKVELYLPSAKQSFHFNGIQ